VAETPQRVTAADPVAMAGEMLAGALRAAMYETELVRLAIPGGSALAALGPARAALGRDFARVQLTWVDERCVPASDADSNRGAAERAGLLGDDGAAAPRHVVPLYLDDESPRDAALRAEDELSALFDSALDVTLLGMGEDGHVASLFPGRFERRVEGCVAHVGDSPKPPPRRMTLTWPMLATSRTTILLAHGEAKRAALQRILAGDPGLPAVGLPGLVVVTDLQLEPRLDAPLDLENHREDDPSEQDGAGSGRSAPAGESS
jgi:6-phosphogluconolactonase